MELNKTHKEEQSLCKEANLGSDGGFAYSALSQRECDLAHCWEMALTKSFYIFACPLPNLTCPSTGIQRGLLQITHTIASMSFRDCC